MKKLALIIFAYFLVANIAISEENNKTVLTFTETLEAEVKPDRISSILKFIITDKNLINAQKKLNTKMETAITEAKRLKGIKVSTNNYRVTEKISQQKTYENGKVTYKRVSDGWQVTQNIKIKGENTKNVMAITLKLQEIGMKSDSISHFISNDLIRKTKNILISDILRSIKSKIKNIQKDIGAKSYLITNIDLNKPNNNIYTQPIRSMGLESFAVSKTTKMPTAIAEEQKIKVTANISVSFKTN